MNTCIFPASMCGSGWCNYEGDFFSWHPFNLLLPALCRHHSHGRDLCVHSAPCHVWWLLRVRLLIVLYPNSGHSQGCLVNKSATTLWGCHTNVIQKFLETCSDHYVECMTIRGSSSAKNSVTGKIWSCWNVSVFSWVFWACFVKL